MKFLSQRVRTILKESAKEFKAILDGDDAAPSVEDNPAGDYRVLFL